MSNPIIEFILDWSPLLLTYCSGFLTCLGVFIMKDDEPKPKKQMSSRSERIASKVSKKDYSSIFQKEKGSVIFPLSSSDIVSLPKKEVNVGGKTFSFSPKIEPDNNGLFRNVR